MSERDPFVVDPTGPAITVDVTFPAGYLEPVPSGTFCTVDLGDWMDLCRRADVAAVPAIRVGEVPVRDLAMFDTPEGDTPEVRSFWAAVNETWRRHPQGWMLRWSCCSCSDIKRRLGDGEVDWAPELMLLSIDDSRAYDLVTEFPRPTISAWLRPWMPFMLWGSYPIEYRAFVWDNELVGISNYYPQRPLFDDDATAADIRYVSEAVYRLIDTQERPLLIPELKHLQPPRNCWTADFGRLPDGAILFLEGGPPHTDRWGAHPCCFKAGDIGGVALTNRNEPEESF